MALHTVLFYGNQAPAFADAALIRRTVFLQEQGFSEDFDATDAVAWHAVIYEDQTPLATGRLFSESQQVYHIGRVAVQQSARKQGIGAALMLALEQKAASLGANTIVLGSQTQAAGFYRSIGYIAYGTPFYEEHFEHISMQKQL